MFRRKSSAVAILRSLGGLGVEGVVSAGSFGCREQPRELVGSEVRLWDTAGSSRSNVVSPLIGPKPRTVAVPGAACLV